MGSFDAAHGNHIAQVMLLHYPVNHYLHAYHMLEKACRAGKVRAISLSNFPVEKIREVPAQAVGAGASGVLPAASNREL